MKCPNCKAPIERIDGYCWNCGQKNKDGRITLGEFFRDILQNVLNIDAKIFRTIRHLFVPGKLSLRYFAGQRQQYFSPFRIFFVTAILHFALFSYLSSDSADDASDFTNDDMDKKGYWQAFKHELDTARNYVLEVFPDSEQVPAAMDTLYRQLPNTGEYTRYVTYLYVNEQGKIQNREINISYEELVQYTPRELAEKYEVKGWLSQLQFQQVIKLQQEGKNFILFLLKNLIWMVIVMVTALAFILKLLYIRRRRFLIEHLVFTFHYHSFAFMLISICMLLDYWQGQDFLWAGFGFLAVLIYLYLAMRRYYQQGHFKTFVKFAFLNFSYLFIFIFSITLTFVVSVFVF